MGALVVPPYAAGSGDRFEITNVNIVGLTRRGADRETIAAIVEAHRLYYRSDLEHDDAIKRIAEGSGDIAEVQKFLDFITRPDEQRQARSVGGRH